MALRFNWMWNLFRTPYKRPSPTDLGNVVGWQFLRDCREKTKKQREVRINANFQKHIRDCYKKLGVLNKQERCFISQRNRVYSIQRINVLLKEIKTGYGLKSVKNFSTHSLRKTFGRHIYENALTNGDLALVMLSELFNYSNIAITKRYLGIRKDEIMGCYDLLEF